MDKGYKKRPQKKGAAPKLDGQRRIVVDGVGGSSHFRALYGPRRPHLALRPSEKKCRNALALVPDAFPALREGRREGGREGGRKLSILMPGEEGVR
jgi:hypothetical protein